MATVAVLAGVQIVTADDAVAVFGGRTVQVLPDQDRVEVSVLFGNVQVVVPDDARVDTEGLLVFGGTDCEAACSGTGTRVVTVDARGAFGSVDVVRQGERARTGDGGRDDGTTRTTTEPARPSGQGLTAAYGRPGPERVGRRAPSSTAASTARSSSPATAQHSGSTTRTASTTWNGKASWVTHSSTASQRFATSRNTLHTLTRPASG